ncbi:MAG: radical SAM protein [Bdellovibrionota bacterium]
MTGCDIKDGRYDTFSKHVWDRSMAGPLPLRAQFELTYACNLHCVHCYSDPFNKQEYLGRELTYNEVLRIFDELADAGVLWLLLTGGEAIRHPEFKRIYTAAKSRGFIVSLFSNATIISEEMADFLAQNPPFKLEVSAHGATRETYERITQVPGSFDQFHAGIRRLLERGLPLKIKTKAMTLNHHELSKIQSFAKGLGDGLEADFTLYTTIHPRLDGDLSPTNYRLSADQIVQLEKQDRKPTTFGPPLNDRLFRCGCGKNSFTINPQGMLRPCTFTICPSYDLKTIPFIEAFRNLVSEISKAHYTGNSACRKCPIHMACDKNPAISAYETGSMENPVPYFCEVARKRAQLNETTKTEGTSQCN